jgi:hypothetical protein
MEVSPICLKAKANIMDRCLRVGNAGLAGVLRVDNKNPR